MNNKEQLTEATMKALQGKLSESTQSLPDFTNILENYDWDVDIVTKDQLGSDYMYHTLITNVQDAEKFNYHSDYWGDADSYQYENVELMEQVEPYVGQEVIVNFDDGAQKFKILGIVIDKQYNSLSHTKILADDLGEVTESKKQTESYTAREQFDAIVSKYSEEDRSAIKVVAETKYYLLTIARGKDDPEFINLDVHTGSTDDHMLPDVYIQQNYKGKCLMAQINWGAHGSCTIEETQKFMSYLNDAIEFAEQINGKDFIDKV